MSAELLREAATLMRERAMAVTDDRGTWFRAPTLHEFTNEIVTEREGRFIESWHPAVALAVADWLDREAELSETLQKHGARGVTGVREHPALAVARAYLGSDPP